MEGVLPILGREAVGIWVRPERERGSQDYWREQMDFMVYLLVLGMESSTLYTLNTPLILYCVPSFPQSNSKVNSVPVLLGTQLQDMRLLYPKGHLSVPPI